MNVEEIRNFCLSLNGGVVEKFPFRQFRAAKDVLAFYIGGHIFCYFDINDISSVNLKADVVDIPLLKERFPCISDPYNGNKKYWIGIDARLADESLIKRLIQRSFDIVSRKKKQ